MKLFAVALMIALVFLLFGFHANAAEDAVTATSETTPAGDAIDAAPSVEDLVTLALSRSPMVAAQRAKAAAMRERVSPAGALEDPMLELSGQENLMDITAPTFSQGALEITQTLPFPGKRRLRRDAASADADAQIAELRKAEREVAMRVRSAYAKLYAADREREYLEASKDLLKMIAAAANSRYSTGEGDQEAPLKAQLSVYRIMERDEELRAERLTILAEINRLLDRPGDQTLGPATLLPVVQPSAPSSYSASETPDVLAKKAAIEAADRRLESAKKDLMPDFLVGVGGGVERNYVDGKEMPMAMLRFGVTLPIWYASKQRPLIRAAEQEKEMAVQERRDAEASARSSAARITAEWEKADRQINLYREALIPQTHAALDAARAAYLTGRGDFSTLVEDFNMWLDARIELARRESDRFAAWAELETQRPVETTAVKTIE